MIRGIGGGDEGRFGGEALVGGATADFKGGGEFDGFDVAEAFDFQGKEGFGGGAVKAGKAVECADDFLGELDHVFALHAGSQENGDKGGVGDGGDAAALDFFAGAKGGGELLDWGRRLVHD